MISGRPTLKVTFAPATGSTAIRSRLLTSTLATSSPVTACCRLEGTACARSFSSSSGTTACPTPSAPITACPLPPPGSMGYRNSTSGGCASAFSTNAFSPPTPTRTGAHERMHKTLKGEAIRPPRANLRAQQRAFYAFRHGYNNDRPHQALHGQTPASLYRPSPRAYTTDAPPLEYPGHYLVKRVTNAGTIRFKKRLLFIANALKPHPVGLEEIDDGRWSLYFCRVLLGRIDERDYIIRT